MRQGMGEQKTKGQVKKKLWDNNHPLATHLHTDMNQPAPTYAIHPSFITTVQWTQNS